MCRKHDKVEISGALICPVCDGWAAVIARENEMRKEGGS
jgi:hypothetical protein